MVSMLREKSVITNPNWWLFLLMVADISWIAPNRVEPYDYILKTYLL